jgi:nitrite reductase/ring-hydroxylating ferredoxin subunit
MWTTVLRDADLPEGESRYAEVEGIGVLVARVDGEVHAISNRCSHRGGPLDEGELHDGCVTCPLHGSIFRLADGGIVRGPAAYPQPRWRTRVRDGAIEVAAPD